MLFGLVFILFILPYTIFAIWVTVKVVKGRHSRLGKVLCGVSTLVGFYLVLLGDRLVGGLYLEYLCETEGGAHIYQTVELGPEYWNEDGSPKFIYPKGHRKAGSIDSDFFNGRYYFNSYDYENRYSFGITKSAYGIKSIRNILLGEYVVFRFSSGWLINNTGIHVSGRLCNTQRGFFNKLIKKVFTKK